MGKLFIGVDNGSAGTIGFINGERGWYGMEQMPHKTCQDYQKTATEVCRVDHAKLWEVLDSAITEVRPDNPGAVKVLIERPFTAKFAFKAMMSGRRALEAVLIVLEQHDIGYEFIDSKEWQGALLPTPGVKFDAKGKKRSNSPGLKRLSHQVGHRLFPVIDETQFPDFDGLMIAEFLRRRESGQLTKD